MTSSILSVAIAVPSVIGTFGAVANQSLIDSQNRSYEYQGTPGDIVDLYVTTDGTHFSPFMSFEVNAAGQCDALNIPDASGSCRAFLRAGAGGGTFAVSGNDITKTMASAATLTSVPITVPGTVGTFGATADVSALIGQARCYAYQGSAGDIVDLFSSSDGAHFSPLISFEGARPVAVTIPDGSGLVKAFLRAKTSVLASTFAVCAIDGTSLAPAPASILSDHGEVAEPSNYSNATGGFTTVINGQFVSVNGHVKVEAQAFLTQTAAGDINLQIIDLSSNTVIIGVTTHITIPGDKCVSFKATANLAPGVNRNWALQAQNTGGQTLTASYASIDIYDLAASFS